MTGREYLRVVKWSPEDRASVAELQREERMHIPRKLRELGHDALCLALVV